MQLSAWLRLTETGKRINMNRLVILKIIFLWTVEIPRADEKYTDNAVLYNYMISDMQRKWLKVVNCRTEMVKCLANWKT